MHDSIQSSIEEFKNTGKFNEAEGNRESNFTVTGVQQPGGKNNKF